jgi:RND family efflux transporter MFP subunit
MKDLQQIQRLYDEQLATRSQLAAAQRAYADARSVVTQQRLMGADHPSETLVAPVRGVVVSLVGAKGDAVAGGTTIATIANAASLVVNMGIEPARAFDVHPGATVWLRIPDTSLTIASQIVSVGSMLNMQSRLVDAVARLPDGALSRPLMVGMTLSARIALSARKGIVIPRSALLSDRHGTFVLLVSAGIAHRRGVTVAFSVGANALISSGLRAHDQVITSGVAGITDGMSVRTH